jgi:hypothetical protein
MPVNGDSPTPLLTAEDVFQWRKELGETNDVIAAAQAKAARLAHLLEHAAVFMPADQAQTVQVTAMPGVGKSATLYQAITRAVGAGGRAMSPKMIREAIENSDDAHLLGSENYLYTAIKRVADKTEIIKQGDGYVLGPAS